MKPLLTSGHGSNGHVAFPAPEKAHVLEHRKCSACGVIHHPGLWTNAPSRFPRPIGTILMKALLELPNDQSLQVQVHWNLYHSLTLYIRAVELRYYQGTIYLSGQQLPNPTWLANSKLVGVHLNHLSAIAPSTLNPLLLSKCLRALISDKTMRAPNRLSNHCS